MDESDGGDDVENAAANATAADGGDDGFLNGGTTSGGSKASDGSAVLVSTLNLVDLVSQDAKSRQQRGRTMDDSGRSRMIYMIYASLIT